MFSEVGHFKNCCCVSRQSQVIITDKKKVSYRRETALQGALVLAEIGRLELRDSILPTLYAAKGQRKMFIFNHCDIVGL